MKTIPFDYELYRENPERWQLLSRDNRPVKILRYKKDYTYPLRGAIDKADRTSWTTGGLKYLSICSNDDITTMQEVADSKPEHRHIDIKPILINLQLDKRTGKFHTTAPFESLEDAMLSKNHVTAFRDWKYLGTISLEQHPQVIELLLAEGFKLKS